MIYKEYGKTKKKISAISFGGMRFPKRSNSEKYSLGFGWIEVNGQNVDYDMDYCAQMLVKASELGINYFDTSPAYNDCMSETIVGSAIPHFKGDFYISTKSDSRTADGLRRDLENSLKKLNIPKINFYHLWCILDLDDYKTRMAKDGPYEGAMKAKEEGLIEHICFSTHCTGSEIAQIVRRKEFDGVTLGYNILNFKFREEGLAAAYENGLGVATMNSCGGGFIPRNAERLDFIRGANDKTVVDAALRFNASHKEVTTALTGMTSIEEVISNARVGDTIEAFSKDEIDALKGKFNSSMDMLCTGCAYCEFCPAGLSPSKFMTAYNQKLLTSDSSVEQVIDFMNWQWHIPIESAAQCMHCGECERRCTQHLPIISRLEEMSRMTK